MVTLSHKYMDAYICQNPLHFDFFFFNYLYLVLIAWGLHCCLWAFSSGGQGLLFIVTHGLLTAAASPVRELRL